MILPSGDIHPTPVQRLGTFFNSEIWIKRDDLIDEQVSGNKLYKLIKNVAFAEANGHASLLTFGGAFSNHIAATAKYAKLKGIKTIGFIRGEKPEPLNPTLKLAIENGMQLRFISRSDYRLKNSPEFLNQLQKEFPNTFIIPEGGANKLGIEGSELILNTDSETFNYIAVAIGTGTTFAGLVNASKPHQTILGFPIHKHDQILNDILNVDEGFSIKHHQIINGYHFGGYAKWKEELIEFIQSIHLNHGLKLDPIYTGKALFGLIKELEKGTIKEKSKVLFVHTGGLQGIQGFEERFKLKLF